MNKLQANICLLAVTLCWSTEVIIFAIVPSEVNPFAVMCIPSLIGACMLLLCFNTRIVEQFRRDKMLLLRRVLLLSALNITYNVLSVYALDYLDVSTGAFTFALTVVILPVMLLIRRRNVPVRTWISALIVLLGICVATVPTIERADLLPLAVMVVVCILRANFIVKLNDYAREHDPITLTTGMVAFNAVLSFIPWCVIQPATFFALTWSSELIASMFVYAYFVVAFTWVMNTYAQRYASPAQATIIYATEIVFSTIWACILPASLIDPVQLSVPIVLGCLLVVFGNVVEVLPFGKKAEDAKAEQREEKQEPAIEQVAGQGSLASAGTDAEVAAVEAADNSGKLQGNPDGTNAANAVLSPVNTIRSHVKSPVARKLALFLALLAVYFVIALPFKVLVVIPGFTDIRPVYMLCPVYGIFFGLPGCWSFAFGNLIGDIASDSLRWSSIAGFIANFLYPYLMYVFWNKLRKKDFHLRTPRTIGLFAASIVACALLQALIITPAVALAYPEVDWVVFALTVILNGSLFPICFATPFVILIQEEFGFKTMREKESIV